MIFEITDTINETDEKYIFDGLLDYNLERIEDKNPGACSTRDFSLS